MSLLERASRRPAVSGGDCIGIGVDPSGRSLTFLKEAEGLPVHEMAGLLDHSLALPTLALANNWLLRFDYFPLNYCGMLINH
jgi:hypothetical protein